MAKRASTRNRPTTARPAPKPAEPATAPTPGLPHTWRWALALTVALTLARLFALRLSPLQLYPDEAQYWAWSRAPAFGYFSKPPMIAWLIAATTGAFGDTESVVRMASPLLHGAAGLFLYGAGRKLYDGWTGLVALLIYTLAPAAQLGAFVASTDTPLCAFLAAALWLYVEFQTLDGRRKTLAAAGFGLALGLAFLSKYAALYGLAGVALHLAVSPDARRAWTWPAAAAAILVFALVITPNLAWNAAHGYATVAETAASAAWDRNQLVNPPAFATFLGAQLLVFGPAPLTILIGGGAFLAWRRRLTAPDLLLASWTLPCLVVVFAEALIVRANANWAAAAYVPAAVLVAAWLVRWRARIWTALILGGEALIAMAFLAVVVDPALADAAGGSAALKGVRGWRDLTTAIVERAEIESMAGPLTAVAVDSRYLFYEGLYYGRGYFGREGPPLRAWLPARTPTNAAEASAPLTPADGARVLAASWEGAGTAAMMKSFARSGDVQINMIGLDRRHSRRLDTFVGEGFQGRR